MICLVEKVLKLATSPRPFAEQFWEEKSPYRRHNRDKGKGKGKLKQGGLKNQPNQPNGSSYRHYYKKGGTRYGISWEQPKSNQPFERRAGRDKGIPKGSMRRSSGIVGGRERIGVLLDIVSGSTVSGEG